MILLLIPYYYHTINTAVVTIDSTLCCLFVNEYVEVLDEKNTCNMGGLEHAQQ